MLKTTARWLAACLIAVSCSMGAGALVAFADQDAGVSQGTTTELTAGELAASVLVAADEDTDISTASDVLVAGDTNTKATKVKAPGKPKLTMYTSKAAGKIWLKVKQMKNVAGYQFVVSKSKSFNLGVKRKISSKRAYVMEGLSANSTYYCKVRAYRLQNGQKKWGKWSAIKRVKTRKIKLAIVDLYPTTQSGVGGLLRRCGCTVVGVASTKIDPARYDGLLIPGGADVNPKRYGEKRWPQTYGVNNKRDRLQIIAIRKFAKAGKPVFGVCRGQQIINVAFGGSLVQHISSGWHIGMRTVHIKKGTWLYKTFGAYESVKHYHHQCVKKLGKNLIATQWDTRDGHIEGIQHATLPVYGLQWHPDHMGARGNMVARKFMRVCVKYSTPLKK